jgi:hypothetical protein
MLANLFDKTAVIVEICLANAVHARTAHWAPSNVGTFGSPRIQATRLPKVQHGQDGGPGAIASNVIWTAGSVFRVLQLRLDSHEAGEIARPNRLNASPTTAAPDSSDDTLPELRSSLMRHEDRRRRQQ